MPTEIQYFYFSNCLQVICNFYCMEHYFPNCPKKDRVGILPLFPLFKRPENNSVCFPCRLPKIDWQRPSNWLQQRPSTHIQKNPQFVVGVHLLSGKKPFSPPFPCRKPWRKCFNIRQISHLKPVQCRQVEINKLHRAACHHCLCWLFIMINVLLW